MSMLMADSPAFRFVTEQLEQLTKMTRDEARGTVRLALRDAGLSASTVSTLELEIVLEKVMPAELKSRRIEDSARLCAELRNRLAGVRDDRAVDSPNAIFERIGRS